MPINQQEVVLTEPISVEPNALLFLNFVQLVWFGKTTNVSPQLTAALQEVIIMELNAFQFNLAQAVVFGTLLSVNVFALPAHSGMEIFVFNVQEVKLIKLMLDASAPMEHSMMDQNVQQLPLINVHQLPIQFGMEMLVFAILDFQ
jgi:hypothetical protein